MPEAASGLPPYLPESIARFDYFLHEINTPFWLWTLRLGLGGLFLLTLLVYRHYRRKERR